MKLERGSGTAAAQGPLVKLGLVGVKRTAAVASGPGSEPLIGLIGQIGVVFSSFLLELDPQSHFVFHPHDGDLRTRARTLNQLK